jgi:hypothetical protein
MNLRKSRPTVTILSFPFMLLSCAPNYMPHGGSQVRRFHLEEASEPAHHVRLA